MASQSVLWVRAMHKETARAIAQSARNLDEEECSLDAQRLQLAKKLQAVTALADSVASNLARRAF